MKPGKYNTRAEHVQPTAAPRGASKSTKQSTQPAANAVVERHAQETVAAIMHLPGVRAMDAKRVFGSMSRPLGDGLANLIATGPEGCGSSFIDRVAKLLSRRTNELNLPADMRRVFTSEALAPSAAAPLAYLVLREMRRFANHAKAQLNKEIGQQQPSATAAMMDRLLFWIAKELKRKGVEKAKCQNTGTGLPRWLGCAGITRKSKNNRPLGKSAAKAIVERHARAAVDDLLREPCVRAMDVAATREQMSGTLGGGLVRLYQAGLKGWGRRCCERMTALVNKGLRELNAPEDMLQLFSPQSVALEAALGLAYIVMSDLRRFAIRERGHDERLVKELNRKPNSITFLVMQCFRLWISDELYPQGAMLQGRVQGVDAGKKAMEAAR